MKWNLRKKRNSGFQSREQKNVVKKKDSSVVKTYARSRSRRYNSTLAEARHATEDSANTWNSNFAYRCEDSSTANGNPAQNQTKTTQSHFSFDIISPESKDDRSRSILFHENLNVKDMALENSTLMKSHSPRCVSIHPSEIASKYQLNMLFNDNSAVTNDFEMPPKWLVGHMLWGKIRGFPYWPCMVAKDPLTKCYSKITGSYKSSRSYHVQFFGARAERSWLNEASLLEFEGREKFLDIVQYGLENPSRGCKSPEDFKISTAWFPAWSLAVAEAEGAYKLSVAERRAQYTFQYVLMKGTEVRPVDMLLEAIFRQSLDKQNPEGRSSDKVVEDMCSDIFDKGGGERHRYDSDDFYSSDDSSSEDIPNRKPVKIAVRQGLFDVFFAKHEGFIRSYHPEWEPPLVFEYLRQQWALMHSFQRNKYTSRHQRPVYIESKLVKRQISRTFEVLDEIDPHKLDLEILKLSGTSCFRICDEDLCCICKEKGNLCPCEGICGNLFHDGCIKQEGSESFTCVNCSSGAQPCYSCKKVDTQTKKCSHMLCTKFYHEECVSELRWTSWEKKGFVCPLHMCATCALEDKTLAMEGQFIHCVKCPTAYHASDFCVAAGCEVGEKGHLICSDHFKPIKSQSLHSRVNVKKCLTCGNGNGLLLCHTCPAAYHEGCDGTTSKLLLMKMVKMNMTFNTPRKVRGKCQTDPWFCANCVHGRKLLYGDIVWIKLGFYRWWPGEVCHPLHVPFRVRQKSHQVGEFPVRFFGSHDYSWVHHGRVYPYSKGNRGSKEAFVTSNLDEDFAQGVREATAAIGLCQSVRKIEKNERLNKEKSIIGDNCETD